MEIGGGGSGAGESGRQEDVGVYARHSGRVLLFVRAFKKLCLLLAEGSAPSVPFPRGPAPSSPSRANVGEVGSALDPRPAPGVAPRLPMATRVLTMSARLGPVPQPPAPQDEPVFAQLKPVLGAANPARDAALFPGEELKHPHHHPQAQPAPAQPPQPAPPPAAGPRLPPEELVQVGRAAALPPSLPPPPSRGSGVSRRCDARATGAAPGWACVGAHGSGRWGGRTRPALPGPPGLGTAFCRA